MIPGGLLTESRFAQVNYPNASFGGVPLTFDLNLKEANLRTLEAQGTLDLFVEVQFLDIGIILGTLLFFSSLALLVSKRFETNSLLRKISLSAVLAFLIAPLMDALENLSILLFISLHSDGKYSWLNLLNSCFTLAKGAFFIIGWILLGISILALAIIWLRHLVDHRSREAT